MPESDSSICNETLNKKQLSFLLFLFSFARIEGVEEGLTSVPPAIPVRELLKGGGGTPTTNKQQQQQQLPAKSPVVDKKDKKEREKEKEREKKEKEAKKIAKK